MNKKLMLNFVFGLFILMGIANAATYYSSYQLEYALDKPNYMQTLSYECLDTSCSQVVPADVSYYKGDGISCWYDYGSQGQAVAFENCMEDFRVTSNVLDLNDCDTISNTCSGDVYMFIKYDTEDSDFGFLNYMFNDGDTYLPMAAREQNFQCDSDICINVEQPAYIFFTKGVDAIAEVGQLNIKNIDNPLFPIQVEVPVTIEETVCSAYRRVENDAYLPQPPQGYDDFSADTLVELTISNNLTGEVYNTEAITIAIDTDTCAGLAAFSWIPDSSLEDTAIKFRVETSVTDEQVVSTIPDWTEVIETIYPQNLEDTCWSRSYDFTLSNIASQDMTTSVAQITLGESLYAVFDAGAFRDNEITPMQFRAQILFDNEEVYNQIHTTTPASTEDDLQTFVVDLTSRILGLTTGNYNVTLITTPIAQQGECDTLESVTQIQNLEIIAPQSNTVTFYVRDQDAEPIEGATINFELLEAQDYFVNPPVYDVTGITNENGVYPFYNVYRGLYQYDVSMTGYSSVSREITIGSNTNIYVTLIEGNYVPIIDLPDEFTEYYQNPIEINLRDYITDHNDLFDDLTITYQVLSGNIQAVRDGDILRLTTTAPTEGAISITVEDTQGDTATDSALIHFIDNQEPEVLNFYATPDSGDAPHFTTFTVDVQDADNEPLTCTLEFGDFSAPVTGDCDELDGTTHTYQNVGTYNAVLTVEDAYFTVEAYEQIFVYERQYSSPHIDWFTMESSNGDMLITDLTFNWQVTHPDDLPMTCTLRVNGVDTAVACAAVDYPITNYNTPGWGVFTLIADDGDHIVTQTIRRYFMASNNEPDINWFTMDSSNGHLLETNLTFNWQVTHPDNLPITCTLTVNGADTPVACAAVDYPIYNYDRSGLGVFTLTADDGTHQSTRTIEMMFAYPGEYNLSEAEVYLDIKKVITPGDFNFSIITYNETLAKREITVEPIIICQGIENHLDNTNGILDTLVVSRKDGEAAYFDLRSNTLDYELAIPKDETCTFRVIVRDDFGTYLLLGANVIFQYPQESLQITSIRGKGVDIVDYMRQTITNSLDRGYNSVQFVVTNNEAEAKELSISMVSRELGINYYEEIDLAPGAQTTVQIPFYISKEQKTGMYPIRYSVRENEDKQVRYSYVNIE